jgi:hypothetical protein
MFNVVCVVFYTVLYGAVLPASVVLGYVGFLRLYCGVVCCGLVCCGCGRTEWVPVHPEFLFGYNMFGLLCLSVADLFSHAGVARVGVTEVVGLLVVRGRAEVVGGCKVVRFKVGEAGSSWRGQRGVWGNGGY